MVGGLSGTTRGVIPTPGSLWTQDLAKVLAAPPVGVS